MNTRKIVIGAVATIVLLAAFQVTRDKAPTTEVTTHRLYPGLIDRINDARRIEIRAQDGAVTIAHDGERWVVASRDNFPARFERVKEALVQLTELDVLETKTSMPEKYGQIGVDEVENAGSTARRVAVYGDGGPPLLELLVGKERPATGLTPPSHYVRKAGEQGALLVQGALGFSAKTNDWLDNAIVDVAADRVRRITVNPREGAPVVITKASREAQFFDLDHVPKGSAPRSKALVSSLGGLLLGVAFDDVAKASIVEGLVPRTIVEVQTFDGLVTTLEEYDVKEKVYVKFGIAYNPDLVVAAPAADTTRDVAAEAKALAAKVADWVYVLPEYKVRLIDRKLEDLIQPVEPPAPAAKP